MATNRKHQLAVRESAGLKREGTKVKQSNTVGKVHVHNDKPSKPQTHRADAAKPGATNFVAVKHPDPKSGWKGRFVPATPKAKKAAATLAKLNAPVYPQSYF